MKMKRTDTKLSEEQKKTLRERTNMDTQGKRQEGRYPGKSKTKWFLWETKPSNPTKIRNNQINRKGHNTKPKVRVPSPAMLWGVLYFEPNRPLRAQIAWMGAVRRESTRGKKELNPSREQNEGTYRVGGEYYGTAWGNVMILLRMRLKAR